LNIGQRVVEIVIKGHDASVAAFKSLTANTKEAKKDLKELANEIPGLSRAMALLTNPLAATAAIVIGLGVALTKAYTATVQLGASMFDMSQRTDMSVEALARWKFIAEQNGATINDFEMSFRKLRQAMAGVAGGDAAAVQMFKTLGVEALDSNGKMRDLETVMLEIGQSVRQYGVESVQGAAAQEALGRGSSALVAVIKQTPEALAAASAEAKAYTTNMNTAWGSTADAADDAGRRYKAALDNLKAGLMPDLSGIQQAWTEMLVEKFNPEGYILLKIAQREAAKNAAKLAATETADAYAEGLIVGWKDLIFPAATEEQVKRNLDALMGEEDARKKAIQDRINSEAAEAKRLYELVAEQNRRLQVISVTGQPQEDRDAALKKLVSGIAGSDTGTDYNPYVEIKLDIDDAKVAEAKTALLDLAAAGGDANLSLLEMQEIMAELPPGLDPEVLAQIVAYYDELKVKVQELAVEQQIVADAGRDIASGFEQIGSAAIQAFAAGEAGAMKFGDMIRQVLIAAVADAIAKFIMLKVVSAFTGGISDALFGGLAQGGRVPALASGGRIPHAAAGYSVPDGPRGMDSRLIAAMPGEEVINRQLSQRLDRFISSMEFGAAVSPFAMSSAGGGRGNVSVNFEVGRPVGVLDALSYGEVAATAAKKVAEANL